VSVFDGAKYLISEQGNASALSSILTNDLPASYRSASYVSSLVSVIAPGGYTVLRSITVSVLADELCVFLTQATVSCGTSGDALAMQHRVNGSLVQNFACMQDIPAGSVNGQQETLICFSATPDLPAGNIVFDVMWNRVAGSGNIYSLHQFLHVLRFKRRA
jgi:hypothetical protein